MKLPALLQPRVLKTALKALLTPPFTTRFPAAPYTAQPSFRGRPRYQAEHCIGCGACAEVCPARCIDVIDDLAARPPQRRLVQHLDSCICCGQCERYCTTEKGIHLTNEFDFAGFKPEDFEEKVEKDLLLCEACGCVIAPLAHLQWIIRRLGPLAFTNSTLMLVSLKELAVVSEPVAAEPNAPHRGQHLMIQCPRCRRATALAV